MIVLFLKEEYRFLYALHIFAYREIGPWIGIIVPIR